MLLRRLAVPGPVSYAKVNQLQEVLVRQFLDAKARSSPGTVLTSPPPTLITTEFCPVYTCGRREIGTLSSEQQDFLRARGQAEFHEAMRGGQTTFHGPGQLIVYPVLDLTRHSLRPRTYVALLERVIMQTCAHYGIETMTTEHAGVWLDPNTKIAALGVHLRRNISSHGVAINVSTDLSWFDRIVACGLPDKKTTNMQLQMQTPPDSSTCTLDSVADVFVSKFAEAFGGVD